MLSFTLPQKGNCSLIFKVTKTCLTFIRLWCDHTVSHSTVQSFPLRQELIILVLQTCPSSPCPSAQLSYNLSKMKQHFRLIFNEFFVDLNSTFLRVTEYRTGIYKFHQCRMDRHGYVEKKETRWTGSLLSRHRVSELHSYRIQLHLSALEGYN